MLSPHDQQVAARDPDLPGLRTLLDPPALLQILQERLGHVELKNIRGDYLRYKPQTNCVASYQLDTSLGQIDIYAKAYTAGDAAKLSKADRPSKSLLGPGSLQLEAIGTGVWIFPNDQDLRYLSVLADESDLRRMLAQILPAAADLHEFSIQRLAYKPERRFVGQLRIGNQPAAVLRFYTQNEFARSSHNAKVLKPATTLQLAGRLGRSKHRAVTAMQWLEGTLLSDVLRAEATDVSSLQQVGRALAEFHQGNSAKLAIKTRQMEVNGFAEIAEFASWLDPQMRQQLEELAGQLAEYFLQQPPQNHCVHGDFYAQQILHQPDGVAFLDLDEAYSGDGAADLGNFLAHLWRAAPQRVQNVQNAILDGYSAAGGRIDVNHINRYTAASLLRLIGEPFRRRQTNWPDEMRSILRQAQSLIADLSVGLGTQEGSVHDPFGVAHDPLMPFLADAIDPATVSDLFQAHLSPPARLLALRVVRYKPQRRCLIEYDIETAGGNSQFSTLIGKARAKRLDEQTFQLQRQLWGSGFGDDSEDGVSVPQPIAMIPRLQLWLQRKVRGAAPIDLLLSDARSEAISRLVHAIFKLHQCPIRPSRSHSMSDELQILHEKLPLVGQRHPHLQQRLRRVLEMCSRMGESFHAAPLHPIHRDFYHDQVILDGSRVYLLDLDLFAMGDPALDIGNFIGHLGEYGLRKLGSADALARQQKEMIDRYVELAGEELRPRIHIYSFLTLARHVYISTLFDDRAHFTESILSLCQADLQKLRECG